MSKWTEKLFGKGKKESGAPVPPAEDAAPPVAAGPKRILIVDDTEIERMILREILENEGYEVIEAENGNRGIEQYRNNDVDLVITDVMMPEKNGIEMMVELNREFPEAVVVAASTGGDYGPEINYDMAQRLGAHTVAKPFDPEEIIDTVRKLIG